MSIFDRPASHSKRYYERQEPPEKCDIKECVKLNDKFIVRKTDKKHTVRQIGTLAIIAMGFLAAAYWIGMMYLRWVVTL